MTEWCFQSIPFAAELCDERVKAWFKNDVVFCLMALDWSLAQPTIIPPASILILTVDA